MHFSTKVTISPTPLRISYQDKIMLIGSCFSEHIGHKFANAYFQSLQNPFGILYNPASIATSLDCVLSNKVFVQNDLIQHNELWHSMLHHGDFSDTKVEHCLNKINTSLAQARLHLANTRTLIITFGTAWIYEQNGRVVGNCHKLAASNFTRRRMDVHEISEQYAALMKRLQDLNPELQIIFTVSPVRHWKDGAHENQLSKSTLHLAIDQLCNAYPSVCSYFPSYEIVMDELRDYRYYAEDMLHPNSVAVDYIWERFAETYFDSDTAQNRKELEQLHRDVLHRPIHIDTEAYQKFSKHVQDKYEVLKKRFPWINKEE